MTQLSNETQPVRQNQAGKQGEGIQRLGFLKMVFHHMYFAISLRLSLSEKHSKNKTYSNRILKSPILNGI